MIEIESYWTDKESNRAVCSDEQAKCSPLRAPVWWICSDGGVRIETGDPFVTIELDRNDANALANMIIRVHDASEAA